MKKLILSLALAALPSRLVGQETHAGHGKPDVSAATLGTIDFPVTANHASHDAFIRGVLLMHNFHYFKAAEAFREAEKLDTSNVMAYWGEAMTYTHPVWNQQDTTGAHVALAKLGPSREARLARAKTEREKMWLDAVETLYAHEGTKAQRDTAYSAAMEKLYRANNADVEATTFYALSLLGLNQGDRDIATYRKAYEILAPVFAAHPKHPGAAHYLIHSVDDPEHAKLGVEAANAYGKIAPDAGHALHMTSHIYLALGKWDDVFDANVRALATVPNGVLIGHSVHWLHYSLLQIGRYREADRWLDSMVKQARSGSDDVKADSWDAAGLMMALAVFDSHRYGDRLSRVRVDQKYLNAASYSEAMVDLAGAEYGYAMAALQNGNRNGVDSVLTFMAKLRSDAANDITKATSRGYVEVMEKSLRGLVQWKSGKLDDALLLFKDAADEEASLPMAFGPPVVIKPPRELAGEILLEMKRPLDAKKQFELGLARTPQRASALLGLARAEKALGDRAASRKTYAQLLAIWHSADSNLPELKEVREGAH